ASLSQARGVTVYTWQNLNRVRGGNGRPRVYMSYLNVDEIARGEMQEIPRPVLDAKPPLNCQGRSGTVVLWTRCDRLDNRRISTIVRKLEAELGRRFRHFLWKHLRILINGEPVSPFDPLYLNPKAEISGAHLFGEELRYEVRADPSNPRSTG